MRSNLKINFLLSAGLLSSVIFVACHSNDSSTPNTTSAAPVFAGDPEFNPLNAGSVNNPSLINADLVQRIRSFYLQYATLPDERVAEQVSLLIAETPEGRSLLIQNWQRLQFAHDQIIRNRWSEFSPVVINQYGLSDYLTEAVLEKTAILHTIAQALDFLHLPPLAFNNAAFVYQEDPIHTWVQFVRIQSVPTFTFLTGIFHSRSPHLISKLPAITLFHTISKQRIEEITIKAEEKTHTKPRRKLDPLKKSDLKKDDREKESQRRIS